MNKATKPLSMKHIEVISVKTGMVFKFACVAALSYGHVYVVNMLTLKVLVATTDAQWEEMGDVGSARYEPALPPPHARP